MVGKAATVMCTLRGRAVFSHASTMAGAPVWVLAHLALAYTQSVKTSAYPIAYLGLRSRREIAHVSSRRGKYGRHRTGTLAPGCAGRSGRYYGPPGAAPRARHSPAVARSRAGGKCTAPD